MCEGQCLAAAMSVAFVRVCRPAARETWRGSVLATQRGKAALDCSLPLRRQIRGAEENAMKEEGKITKKISRHFLADMQHGPRLHL